MEWILTTNLITIQRSLKKDIVKESHILLVTLLLPTWDHVFDFVCLTLC